MKKLTLLLLSFLLCISSYKAIAQSVTEQDASTVAKNFLVYHSAAFTVGEMVAITENARHLGWVVPLSPNGFILVSSSYDLRPILAYSFESSWETGGNEQEIFQTLMRFDLANRLDFAAESGKGKAKIQQEWRKFLTGNIAKTRFEQWPPAGTTPTGGWLFANWTQNAPYNGMCPIDPNTNSRSVNGCPATAMAMILNCLEDIKGTRLSDADDYYHNFGAGNKYWIDNDWQAHGFPYFDSLNLYLDTLESSYLWSKPLSNGQKAALNFACGVALKQVYSSSVSGTWGIEQAAAAWQRFGFAESRLVYDSDTTLNSDLAENIKQGWPAHLGLVDPPVSVGHNVVVDGYNTAVDGDGAHLLVRRKLFKHRRGLQREFACGAEDQRLGLAVCRVDLFDDRHRERCGFARASLGDSDEVTSAEKGFKALLLNRGRGFVAGRLKRLLHFRG